MKKITLLFICLLSNFVFSHTINYDNIVLRHWSIQKEHKCIDGTFMMFKNGTVFIEDANNTISKFPLSYLSKEDQAFVMKKEEWVRQINNDLIAKNTISEETIQSAWNTKLWAISIGMFLIVFAVFAFVDRKKRNYLIPMVLVGSIIVVYGFAKKNMLTTTDPAFVNSAFAPFASTVSTSWDDTYFYVNSKGIPNHTMMVGITGWQQQVPIPQCYIGTNAWSIPLNPTIATTPVPVNKDHFGIGAVALAANGVAIFNLYTTSGQDSYATGQLDNFGGHCGKGDDYHYHTAPLHLITSGQTTANLPIAFALDGFAIYGGLEPDGSPMTPLDGINHGHYGTNGVYHYHGTANPDGSNPQMITNMVGNVTEANSEIVPQAHSSHVRTENWTPLKGPLLITSCSPKSGNNGYNLSYTWNGISGYATNFSWSGKIYTFDYVTPTGTTTTTYNNGFFQCTVPNLGINEFAFNDKNISVYPNPATDVLNVKVNNGVSENDVQSISIYGIKGELISKTLHYKENIDIKTLSKGTYLVKIQFPNYLVTKKVLVK